MLCYIYCSLAAAYAKTMWSVKQERSTSIITSVRLSSRPSEFILPRKLGKTGLHENTSLGIEKQLRTELNSNHLMSYHEN